MKTKTASRTRNYLSNNTSVILTLLTLLFANLAFIPKVFATTYLTHTTVMEYNMNATSTSQVAVAFTAGASDAAGSVVLTFTGWTGGAAGIIGASGSQTVTTTGCVALTGATNALATSGVTSTPASGIITVTYTGSLTSGSSYCYILNYASAVTNPTATGVYQVTATIDGTDTNTVGIDVISNDQIVVSATVLPSFTMVLTPNTDTLGNLTSSNYIVSTNNVSATINTNAVYGWSLWVEDSNAGLHSTLASKTIASLSVANHAMNAGQIGTEGYVIGAPTITTGTVAAPYVDATGYSGGGVLNTGYSLLASNTVASSSDAVAIKEIADISGTTPPATDYTDTITVVGAGSF
jgi:hypothetical protein